MKLNTDKKISLDEAIEIVDKVKTWSSEWMGYSYGGYAYQGKITQSDKKDEYLEVSVGKSLWTFRPFIEIEFIKRLDSTTLFSQIAGFFSGKPEILSQKYNEIDLKSKRKVEAREASKLEYAFGNYQKILTQSN